MSTHAKKRRMSDVMTAAPHTIGSNQKLSRAHRLMNEHGLRHLPVLRAGKLVGILSQRDLYFLETIQGVDVDLDVVADAMSPEVYTTGPDADLYDVVRTMHEHKYGCAVVMKHDKVAGIFTMSDALRELVHLLG